MIVYISGPISGVENYEKSFNEAEAEMARQGHTVINPAVETLGLTRKDYMRISIARLESADCLLLLPGWKASKGANIEKLYAEYIGLFVFEYEEGTI